jgi:hypothetical protein
MIGAEKARRLDAVVYIVVIVSISYPMLGYLITVAGGSDSVPHTHLALAYWVVLGLLVLAFSVSCLFSLDRQNLGPYLGVTMIILGSNAISNTHSGTVASWDFLSFYGRVAASLLEGNDVCELQSSVFWCGRYPAILIYGYVFDGWSQSAGTQLLPSWLLLSVCRDVLFLTIFISREKINGAILLYICSYLLAFRTPFMESLTAQGGYAEIYVSGWCGMAAILVCEPRYRKRYWPAVTFLLALVFLSKEYAWLHACGMLVIYLVAYADLESEYTIPQTNFWLLLLLLGLGTCLAVFSVTWSEDISTTLQQIHNNLVNAIVYKTSFSLLFMASVGFVYCFYINTRTNKTIPAIKTFLLVPFLFLLLPLYISLISKYFYLHSLPWRDTSLSRFILSGSAFWFVAGVLAADTFSSSFLLSQKTAEIENA